MHSNLAERNKTEKSIRLEGVKQIELEKKLVCLQYCPLRLLRKRTRGGCSEELTKRKVRH